MRVNVHYLVLFSLRGHFMVCDDAMKLYFIYIKGKLFKKLFGVESTSDLL